MLQLSGICSISEKAAFARFQKCGEWLRRLRERICRNNEAIIEPPECPGNRKVYLADAGGEAAHEIGEADCRLHYAIELIWR